MRRTPLQSPRRQADGIVDTRSKLDRDGVLLRFRLTFELIWKALKVNLEQKGYIATTPKDCLKAAFKSGWITDDVIFLDMLEARNKMSHEYDESEAQKVFKLIKKRFLKPIKTLLDRLENIP